jgi:hypothetical protein
MAMFLFILGLFRGPAPQSMDDTCTGDTCIIQQGGGTGG